MRTRKALLLIALSLLTSVAFMSSADAHNDKRATNATSGNDSGTSTNHAFAWATNGCTKVPDSASGLFYFNHACDHHDGCYGGHWESRLGCDNRFASNMNSSCDYNWAWYNPARPLCKKVKDTYYAGVRALGYEAYNGWSISGPSGW